MFKLEFMYLLRMEEGKYNKSGICRRLKELKNVLIMVKMTHHLSIFTELWQF